MLEFREEVVSASDVRPTILWLNISHIWHTTLETLQEFQSPYLIGSIPQDFQETYASRNSPPLNKAVVMLDFPHERKKSSCDIVRS